MQKEGILHGLCHESRKSFGHAPQTQRLTPAPDLIPFRGQRLANSLCVIVVLKCFPALALGQIKMSFPLQKGTGPRFIRTRFFVK